MTTLKDIISDYQCRIITGKEEKECKDRLFKWALHNANEYSETMDSLLLSLQHSLDSNIKMRSYIEGLPKYKEFNSIVEAKEREAESRAAINRA